MATTTISRAELEKLLGTVQVLSSAFSNMLDTYFTPGPRWQANIETGEINYDLAVTAMLDHRQRVAIAAHEIAHLRHTTKYRWKGRRLADPEERLAHRLMNAVEDRRIELAICEEFPGLEPPIRSMNTALALPAVVRAAQNAAPVVQALYGVLQVAYERPFVPACREVGQMLADFEDEILDAATADSTQAVANILGRPGGLLEALLEIKATVRRNPAQENPDAGDLPDSPEDSGAEDADEDGGERSGESGSQESSEGDDLDADSEGDADGDDLDDPGAESPAGDMPTSSEIAQLPDDLRKLLSEALATSEAHGEAAGAVEQDVEKILAAMGEQSRELAQLRDAVSRAQAGGGGADDRRIGEVTDEDFDHYTELNERTHQGSSVLGRGLMVILEENRADRFSGVAYRTGPRLHVPALTRGALVGEDRIWRRRSRNLNRNYVFAVLCDVSSSMSFHQRKEAAAATVLAANAVARCDGCACAVYSFGTFVLQLKDFEQECDERAAYLGALLRIDCGGTNMGEAIDRASKDMLARYDDSYRRVILVMTDGYPGGRDPEPIVRNLIRRHDFDCFGIGIQVSGDLARIFPHWIQVADASELPRTLQRMMQKAVVRG